MIKYKYPLVFWTTGCFFFAFLLYMILISIPNPIQNRHPIFKKNFIHKSIPEGWGFFTKDPKVENYVLYRVSDSILIKINLINNQLKYAFGANREARQLNSKLGQIVSHVKNKAWLTCKGDIRYLKKEQINDMKPLIFYASEPCFFGDFIVKKTSQLVGLGTLIPAK